VKQAKTKETKPWQLMRLLGQSDKGASRAYGAGGVLSRLWSQMLKDLGVNIQRWNDYMYTFVNDPRNGYPPTKRDQQSARGNLIKEFSRPQMTWKVFMKALRFLRAKDVTIALEVNYHNGTRSVQGRLRLRAAACELHAGDSQ
jgi:hypothetical protein